MSHKDRADREGSKASPAPDERGNRSEETDRDLRQQADRVLRVVLSVVLVFSILGVIYVAFDPPWEADPYTEFYLLGPEGKASEYPTRLGPEESGHVVVGVTNHEGQQTTYLLRVVDTNATGDGTLAFASRSVPPGETWETNISFSIDEPGRHRVQFQLYKWEVTDEPYLTTRLWVNVTNVEQRATRSPANGTGSAEVER